jgi:hypothetical protein
MTFINSSSIPLEVKDLNLFLLMYVNDMAVTESLSPMVQPNPDARSPINAVSTPIITIDAVKHAQPPQ